MELNENIKDLLLSLDPAHKIVLNDQNMYIIKLHRNEKFEKWLDNKKLYITKKPYYNEEFLSKIKSDQTIIKPNYVTIAVIGKNGQKDIDLSCCKLDISRLADDILMNNEDSGIICNGAYFFLELHISSKMYGISDNDKAFYPIGPFKYDMDTTGTKLNNIENVSTLQPIEQSKEYFSLYNIKEYISLLQINKDNTVEIIPLEKFNYSNTHSENQVLMGNTLVYNGKIKIDEKEVFNLFYTVKEISDLKTIIPRFTVCKICDEVGNNVLFETVVKLIEDMNNSIYANIYIKTKENKIVKTTFNPENIYSIFDNNLLKKKMKNFIGEIQPGLPMHASDLNPRTCLMIDDKDNVMIIEVEGRRPFCGGIGIDLFDLARWCKAFGAKHAINLDGGGSSKLLWKEKNTTTTEYVGQRAYNIGNAIVVKPK